MSKIDDGARERDACANGSALTLAVALPAKVQQRISVFRRGLKLPFCFEVLIPEKNYFTFEKGSRSEELRIHFQWAFPKSLLLQPAGASLAKTQCRRMWSFAFVPFILFTRASTFSCLTSAAILHYTESPLHCIFCV